MHDKSYYHTIEIKNLISVIKEKIIFPLIYEYKYEKIIEFIYLRRTIINDNNNTYKLISLLNCFNSSRNITRKVGK